MIVAQGNACLSTDWSMCSRLRIVDGVQEHRSRSCGGAHARQVAIEIDIALVVGCELRTRLSFAHDGGELHIRLLLAQRPGFRLHLLAGHPTPIDEHYVAGGKTMDIKMILWDFLEHNLLSISQLKRGYY